MKEKIKVIAEDISHKINTLPEEVKNEWHEIMTQHHLTNDRNFMESEIDEINEVISDIVSETMKAYPDVKDYIVELYKNDKELSINTLLVAKMNTAAESVLFCEKPAYMLSGYIGFDVSEIEGTYVVEPVVSVDADCTTINSQWLSEPLHRRIMFEVTEMFIEDAEQNYYGTYYDIEDEMEEM